MPSSPSPPPSWELLARNHIHGREWSLIRNVWVAAALGFEPALTSELPEAVETILSPDFETRPRVFVFEFVGGQVAAFQDAAAAVIKCAYVLRTVGNCLLSGQPTWASVDAYHLALLGCRALLALLGVHFVRVHDTHCVLDVFPQGILDQTIRRFRRDNPGVRNPARLVFRARGALIEQRAMWAILVRVLNVTKLPDDLSAKVSAIQELGTGFGRSRNDMLYGNNRWLYEEDYQRPSSEVIIEDDIHMYDDLEGFFVEERDANFAFAAVVVRLILALVADIQAESGVSLLRTSYGMCLTKFEGFSSSKIDALFASMYRKECYGLEV